MNGAPTPPRYSLFSGDTLDALRRAHAEALGAGDAEAARRCEAIERGVAHSDAGRQDEARAQIDGAIADATDERLLFLGFQFHFRAGRLDDAERLARRRIELAPAQSPAASRACTNLGLVLLTRGQLDAAEAMQRRALAIDRALGDEAGIARDLGNLALVPEARGDLDAAEALYLEALEIAERIGAKAIAATKLANLGDIAMARGRREEARALWTSARDLFEAAGEAKHRDEMLRKIREVEGSAT